MSALNVADRLGELTTPTLMIAGGVDGLLGPNLRDYLRLPNAALEVLSRAGHEVAVHEPERVADAIDKFMQHGPITAATLMAAHRINAVVVMRDAEALGVISQTDVVLARQGRSREAAQALPVGEIMTEGCITCDVEASLSDAISTMARLKVHRLVVTRNEGGRDVPVGLLSMTDIVRKVML